GCRLCHERAVSCGICGFAPQNIMTCQVFCEASPLFGSTNGVETISLRFNETAEQFFIRRIAREL
ncbi:MAG: hypothetical protein ACQKBV_05865, partial [Puniceicoccales bacterium]